MPSISLLQHFSCIASYMYGIVISASYLSTPFRAMLSSKYFPIISFTAGSVVVRLAIEGDGVWRYLIPDREEMLNSLVS